MPCLRCLRMITTKRHQYMEGVCSRRGKAQDKPRAGSYKGTDQKESAQLSYSSDPKEAQGCILYPREPKTSAWLYSHELGRMYLDETFSDKLETEYVAGVDENNVEQVLEDIIKAGADIIFVWDRR